MRLLVWRKGLPYLMRETGEFDIPVTEMYRLREAAKLAGNVLPRHDPNGYLKPPERTKKLDMLGTATVPEEFKELSCEHE